MYQLTPGPYWLCPEINIIFYKGYVLCFVAWAPYYNMFHVFLLNAKTTVITDKCIHYYNIQRCEWVACGLDLGGGGREEGGEGGELVVAAGGGGGLF